MCNVCSQTFRKMSCLCDFCQRPLTKRRIASIQAMQLHYHLCVPTARHVANNETSTQIFSAFSLYEYFNSFISETSCYTHKDCHIFKVILTYIID